jgi:hypothetical protein
MGGGRGLLFVSGILASVLHVPPTGARRQSIKLKLKRHNSLVTNV